MAGRNAAGATETYRAVPSIGAINTTSISRVLASRILPRSVYAANLPGKGKNGAISYALGINAQRDLGAVRRLIERNIPVDPEALTDPSKSLRCDVEGESPINEQKVTGATRQQKSVTAIKSFKAAALRMRSMAACYSRSEYMPCPAGIIIQGDLPSDDALGLRVKMPRASALAMSFSITARLGAMP
jgi:Reductase C-terminal